MQSYQQALYNNACSPVLPDIVVLLQSSLDVCPLHTPPAHAQDPSRKADSVAKGTGTYPTMATTNGAGQHDDWKPRDMEGEMRALCAGLKSKVDKFLETETADELLRDVQRQVRVAKGVIDDALKQYSYVVLCIAFPPSLHRAPVHAAGPCFVLRVTADSLAVTTDPTNWPCPITAGKTAWCF